MKKSIAKNYIYNLIYQIIILILPLVTTPYISKVLGAENVGIYSYTLSIATYFILFGTFGITTYGQREIAYLQDNKEERTKVFWEIILLRLFTMFISMIAFYIFYVEGKQYQIYYKILILELVATCFDISWFFQGLEEFKKTVIRNVIIKIISVISIFIFVKTKEDLIIYFIIYVLSNLLGNISLWFYLPRYLCKVKVKELNIKRNIRPTISLFIPQIAIQIYTVLDKTMIGKILGDMVEVGNYEQSQKIIKMSLTVITSLGTVVSPRIASTIVKGKKEEVKHYLANSFNFVWFLGIPMMFGIMAISLKLVPWFLGEEFIKSIGILMLGAPIIMAIGLNNVSGIQYLIAVKKQNIFTKSVIIGAVFNFCLNLILINLFGAVGAIISSALAETLILFVQLVYIRKDISLKIVYNNCMKYILSGIIMFVITFFVGLYMKATIITTIIQIIIGIIVYGIMLLLLKDKFLYEIINRIKNKIVGEN